jgi:hypothetical protein
MGFSTFSGPLRSGTQRYNPGRNTGLVVLTQSYDSGDLTGTGVGTTNTAIAILPAGSQIVNIILDQVVASTAGTTTVTFGTASGGTQLLSPGASTAGGRFQGTPTAANLLAWQTSTTADTTVWLNNTTGTATLTAGRFIATIVYVQRDSTGAQNPTASQN